MFSVSTSASKWVTEPAFDVGQVGRVAEREHVRLRDRLQRPRVGGDEAQVVAEPGRALDVSAPPCRGR